MILDSINKANDIKNISSEDLPQLAREIRGFLVKKVSKTGGHLASNLGVVELTMALHLVLDLPKDKIIWDVGHQAYVHKILTGRKNEFNTLRTSGGLSGFPKRRESEYDFFDTGHSSTSISAALGLATAAELKGDDGKIVAVIGDGSMTGGLAYEALNNVSKLKRNLIIILNDNKMSISENVGGFPTYLSKVRGGDTYNDIKLGVVDTLEKIPVVGDKMVKRIKHTKDSIKKMLIPGAFFEDMGITYLGPLDGHNIMQMKRILAEAVHIDHPVLIHVCTKKGKGYKIAEENPAKFHGIGAFDPKTGELKKKSNGPSYSKVFADALINEAGSNENIVAITAAMADGTGLSAFAEKYPERFFDVGIAEAHGVTFAAGLAVAGLKPFVAIYSSFLQRAYDQILEDVSLQNLPVTFCIDRAGLVGEDGETHQGLFDISYMMTVPNMNILVPKNGKELANAVKFASGFNAPIAIRYPRGSASDEFEEFDEPIIYGKSEVMYMEKDVAILAAGTMVHEGAIVRENLKKKGLNCSLINMRFVKPLDEALIDELLKEHNVLVTMEENVLAGGFGTIANKIIRDKSPVVKVINFAVPNSFVEQGTRGQQLMDCGIDAETMTEKIQILLGIE